MTPKIQLILPKSQGIRETDDGYRFRVGLNMPQPVFAALLAILAASTIGVTLLKGNEFSQGLMMFAITSIVAAYFVFGGRLGAEVEVSPSRLKLIRFGQEEFSIETDNIASVYIPNHTFVTGEANLLDADMNLIGRLPLLCPKIISTPLLPVIMPVKVPIFAFYGGDTKSFSPVPSYDALVQAMLLCTVTFNHYLWLSKPPENPVPLALLNLRLVMVIIYTVGGTWLGVKFYKAHLNRDKDKLPENILDRSLGTTHENPVLRSLTRIGLGFDHDGPTGEFKCLRSEKYVPTTKELKQSAVFEALLYSFITICVLFVVTFLLVDTFLGKVPFGLAAYLLATSSVLAVVAGFSLYSLTRYRRAVNGLENLDAMICLGENPTINGKPIEKLQFLSDPFLTSLNGEIPVFPQVVTAGEYHYHLDLRYFVSVDYDPDESEEGDR